MIDPSTPLAALPAVALDTEATGLDVRRARLIEFGAVPIDAGRLAPDKAYATLVDCGEPVPASASAVHGLTNATLAGAPNFAAVAGDVGRVLAGRVVVGHTIGFDLALLDRERQRAGLPPERPLALDVRVLARMVERELPSYSLEGLVAWLGVEPGERHRALGDAETAGRVFLALVPRLREAGIRTLGEALARARALGEAASGREPKEWDISTGPERAEPALARVDPYPYRHRVAEAMSAPPFTLPAGTRLADALAILANRRISSCLVATDEAEPDGIVTERDILRALARHGAGALELSIGALASRPLVTVPADALVYRAIGRMARRDIRHLVAVDADDRVVGVVSARDLLKLRSASAIALGDDIDEARDVPGLAAAWAKLPVVARALAAEGLDARRVGAVVAREVGALTRRAAEIAEAELAAGPMGPAPCGYAILVLGSAGRGESLLAMDQDNAVLFERGAPDGPEDRWFAAHGARMAAILHEVGVPLCPGGVMARELAFRGSMETWRARMEGWLRRAAPEDVLAVDIVFDFRAVNGARAPATELWRAAWRGARGRTAFLRQMAMQADEPRDDVTLFGNLRVDGEGRIDLKRAVLKGIVTVARVLAVRGGVEAHATADRLAGLIAAGGPGRTDLEALDRDHALALDLILEQQLADIAAGSPPGNGVEARRLTPARTRALKEAFARQAAFGTLLRDALGVDEAPGR